MIYVLHVQTGKEVDVVNRLAEQNITAYAPRHELLERHKGVWSTVSRIIFSGYVFVDIYKLDSNLYYKVRNINDVVKFLGSPPIPLSVWEANRLDWVFDTNVLTVSKGYIENCKVKITHGILVGKEHHIIKHNRRQKRCTLFCEINGKRHFFDLSVELEKI